ncbi:uncharacterized protein LOC107013480 [Solanum pennellii]|uniref:Uncharacterized protein LOC107013480 n=1 Tax=Solanum pennellii TaxID=28526 RepID=A0ABM1GBU5_SOLPN|nr:uncharacterized protein LOC107013480 [Solanum pennellii]
MPPRRAARYHPTRMNVAPQEHELPNVPKVQPQWVVTDAEFCETIRMLSKVLTNKVGQKKGADTLRIRDFWRMNPPSFTSSSIINDPENFIDEPKKLKDGIDEDPPPASWAFFEEDFLGCFFPRGMGEGKNGPAPSYVTSPAANNKGENYGQSSRVKHAYCSVVQGGSQPPANATCIRDQSGVCR